MSAPRSDIGRTHCFHNAAAMIVSVLRASSSSPRICVLRSHRRSSRDLTLARRERQIARASASSAGCPGADHDQGLPLWHPSRSWSRNGLAKNSTAPDSWCTAIADIAMRRNERKWESPAPYGPVRADRSSPLTGPACAHRGQARGQSRLRGARNSCGEGTTATFSATDPIRLARAREPRRRHNDRKQ